MKTKMNPLLKSARRVFTLLLSVLILFPFALNAQYGYSSASMGMGKMRSNDGQIPAPGEINVEEYVNYHRHNIPLPRDGQQVAMDVRWGNSLISPVTENAILQIGLTTTKVKSLEEIPAVNISLVIDKSGSMTGDRIAKAREAAKEFVKRLRSNDRISIVLFDHMVQVLCPSQLVGNKSALLAAIETIQPGGSTNLNDGLITGYSEVIKNYCTSGTNRVIMLTDAITNTGVIDPVQIIRNSSVYVKENDVDVTLIGVGVDFNNDLSRQITQSSSSSIHFLNDEEDLKKVFIDEVESLLSPVAKNVKLEIEFSSSLELINMYGYAPVTSAGKITLILDNMNSGLTQVVLLKFKPNVSGDNKILIKTRLTYTDARTKKNGELTGTAVLTLDRRSSSVPDRLADKEVKKNYTIAFMAQALKDMAIQYQNNDSKKGQDAVTAAIRDVEQRYPSWQNDADVKRLMDILRKYVKTTPVASNTY